MKLKLGFSPCPNDTYMFYALVHETAVGGGLNFDTHIMDIEELNQWAYAGLPDICKVSFRTYYEIADRYDLIGAGAALGNGNGPLLIAKQAWKKNEIDQLTIAIPGERTTATFLLQFAYPNAKNLIPMLFSDIEQAILSGTCDAGVIIHETRFLYKQRGLRCIDDLGEVWESKTGSPIPLGCIVARKDLPQKIKEGVRDGIRASITFAERHREQVNAFVRAHAQELEDTVIEQHIAMFVNAFSRDLGTEGRLAVEALFEVLNQTNQGSKTPHIV